MGNCKLAMLHPTLKFIETYCCDYIRKAHDELKFRYRKINGTDEIHKRGLKDNSYDEWCEQIDEFIRNCKCKVDKDKWDIVKKEINGGI